MPITRSNQTWSIGSLVKIGFLRFEVVGIEPTPGDSMPDIYLLRRKTQAGNTISYRFRPHWGLERIG